MQTQTFDAIVVGSGISGGWAAKELTRKGPAGRWCSSAAATSEHVMDYPTANKDPWELPGRDRADAVGAGDSQCRSSAAPAS